MAFALASGYDVTEAENGKRALAALRADRFDLVITDYDMPGMTGADLLKRAGAEGILGEASSLVVTAHPDPQGVPDDTAMLRKPLDLERLLVQVRTIVPAHKAGRGAPPPAASETHALHLVLYVSRRSPASQKARKRMDQVLAEFDSAQVHFEVCDLYENAESAEKDRVVFTPTLVKRKPGPRTWILGDLASADVVRDLLAMCGIARKAEAAGPR